jgi:hypothetical protein
MSPEDAFRNLRNAWFNKVLKSRAHEREWEDQEAEDRREMNNARKRYAFDIQTEEILRGEDRCIAPICINDMRKGENEN